MLLTKDSLSQNMEAIKRKYEVFVLSYFFVSVSHWRDVTDNSDV